jgi:protein-S-isoprenylcysteine O-methyltransferase Ste14
MILDPRLAFVMAACLVVSLTQPEFRVEDVEKHANSDKMSVVAILAAGGASQIVPVVEWAYFRDTGSADPWWTVLGVAMLTSGVMFRVWSIRTLGRFFTSTVTIRYGHKGVSGGPYRYVRHPSYLGAYVAITGTAVLLQTPVSAIVAASLMGTVYAYRIIIEERVLIAELGSEYRAYTQRTRRLISYVW